MAPKRKTRVDADGNILDPSADHQPTRDGETPRPSFMAPLFENHATIDTFGFNLDRKQFATVMILAWLMMGLKSLFILFMALFVYHGYQRIADRATSSINSSWSRGSGGGERWGRNRGIRGISDLPCDPVRG